MAEQPVLLWGAGAGEIRAGVMTDGVLSAFRIIRLRRGEKALMQAGEHYTAQIVSRLPNHQALVSLGGDMAVLHPAPTVPEGARLAVEMVRAPVPEPGRFKRAKVRPAPDVTPQAAPGWHFSAEPWELFLRRIAPEVSAIVCPDAGSANEVERLLGGDAPPVRIDPVAIEDADFDALMEQAVSGEFPIADGLLTIERTRAMTVIDVDGTAPARDLNQSAALEIPRLLHLLDIGGPIGIDFISLSSRAERLAIDEAFGQACAVLGKHERTATNGFGFCQLIRPRTGPSIPEILCGTVPGQLTLESRATALLRAAGKSQGHGLRRVTAPPALIDLIRSWPEEIAALQSALGCAIELVPETGGARYGTVHVSQS